VIEHQLDIDGHHIVALEYNPDADSTPVIFLHGIGATVYFWEPFQIHKIKAQYHWYSLSLPGHFPARFPTDFRTEQLTPDLFARVLSEAVRQLTNSKPAIVIGYSTGGFAAYCIAHHAPQLVERLIIVDGFSQGIWHGALRPLQQVMNLGSIGALLFSLFSHLGTLNFSAFRWSFIQLGSDHSAVMAYPGFEGIVRETLRVVKEQHIPSIARYYRVMLHTDIGGWLQEIDRPAHLIHGTNDMIIQPEHAEVMHSLLPNSTLTWIKDSGHLPMLERPQEYEMSLEKALTG
jgi:pimeloyl-ACP methyl ester carboxylesterase